MSDVSLRFQERCRITTDATASSMPMTPPPFSARAISAPLTCRAPASQVRAHFDAIQHVTDGDSLAEVCEQITRHASDDAWMQRAAKSLAVGSPTSAALSWEIWRRSRLFGLADVFRMEWTLSVQCCAHPDFREGVRALLVDKDNAPRWTPATLAEVSRAQGLLLGRLREAIARLNPGIPAAAREDAVQQVQNLGLPAQLARNRRAEGIELVQQYLSEGWITFEPDVWAGFAAEFGGYRWATRADPHSRERYDTSTPVDHHGDRLDALRYALMAMYYDQLNRSGRAPFTAVDLRR